MADLSSNQVVNWDEVPHFVNESNQKIFCRYWQPEDMSKLKGIVFIVHGAGEHCGWYKIFGEMLAKMGILTCAHDHIGHGLSEGDRVHVDDFSKYSRDLKQHVGIMKEKHGELPIFLIGHSMGGTISVLSGLENPELYKGIVLIGPAIVPNPSTATPVKVAMAKFAAWVLPQLQVGKIDKSWISRDTEIQKAYEDDPLNWHGGLKARWAVSLLSTLQLIQNRIPEIRWPFLVVHGSEDKLCEISGSEMLNDKASSQDKTYKVFEGAYHQVHNEPAGQGEQCRLMIVNWISQRLNA